MSLQHCGHQNAMISQMLMIEVLSCRSVRMSRANAIVATAPVRGEYGVLCYPLF